MFKYVVKVDDKFVRSDGGLSNEYPDAYLFKKFNVAIDAAEQLRKDVRFSDPSINIQVISNYGMEDETLDYDA